MVVDTNFSSPDDGKNKNIIDGQNIELQPQVQASTVETVGQVTQVLETPKIDLGQVMNYQIVDISTLTGNESEGQLKAMIAKGIRTTSIVVSDDIVKYVKSMDSTYSDELFLQMTQAIDLIMKGIQDKLNEKLSTSGNSQVVLPEGISLRIANLSHKVKNAGTVNSDELKDINTDAGVKLGKLIRSGDIGKQTVSGGLSLGAVAVPMVLLNPFIGIPVGIVAGGMTYYLSKKYVPNLSRRNVKANVQEVFKSNVQRLKDLEELNPEIEKLTEELKQFPLLAIEEINEYLSTELYLNQLVKYIDTVLRERVKNSPHIDNDLKGILDNDITDRTHSISYIANVLKFASTELITDISSSGVLSKDMRRDFLTAKYTTIVAAKSSQTRDVLKKGVQIVDGIHKLEHASLDSLTAESRAIAEAITGLKEGQLATVKKLSDAAIGFKTLSEKTNERRTQIQQDMGKALSDLSVNTTNLQQHLLGVNNK